MFRKGDSVKLLSFDSRNIPKPKIGTIGVVLGVRCSDRQVLVKWQGKSGPVAYSWNNVEKI